MMEFRKGSIERPSDEKLRALAEKMGYTVEQAQATLDDILKSETVWLNDVYQVNRRVTGDFIHLSIKRIDRRPIHDWRDLQEIKNEVAGEETVAIEIYPAAQDLVYEENIRHLWVVPPDFPLPNLRRRW